MSQINVRNLSFCYDGSFDNIFENVSFSLDSAWKLGFIGRNGKGKTTFLRLLLGDYEYRGSIESSVEFEYFPFELDDGGLTAMDAAYTIAPDFELWQLQREMNILGVAQDALYRPLSTLSPGERTKLMLAVLFLKQNAFLLIDEPTNNLDAQTRELLGSWLSKKQGFILVSHDRVFLDSCIDHVLSINRESIELQSGNFSSWEQNRTLRESFEQSENERLKREISKLEEASKRSAEWADSAERSKIGRSASGHERPKNYRSFVAEKSRKMMARSTQLEKRQQRDIDEKSSLLKDFEKSVKLELRPLEHYAKKSVVIEDLCITRGERRLFEHLSFSIANGERVCLKGRNGSGKTSLIKLICGEDVPHSGRVQLASGLIISLVGQDTSYLRGSLSDFAREQGVDETLFKSILNKLDFSKVQLFKDMSELSAGQKKKVLIAASLCQQAHLYIWDEPLNYIDLFSRIQLEAMLLEAKPTLLFVEHDRRFCENVATKTVEL